MDKRYTVTQDLVVNTLKAPSGIRGHYAIIRNSAGLVISGRSWGVTEDDAIASAADFLKRNYESVKESRHG